MQEEELQEPQEGMEEEGEGGAGLDLEELAKQVDPKTKKKVEAFNMALSRMVHGKKTRDDVLEMLKSAPPEVSVPQATLTVHGQLEQELKKRGEEPSMEVRLAGGVFLVSELVEVGNAAGLWEIPVEEGMATFLEPAMTEYIHKGLKDGSIDPVELQAAVEPLMSDEERAQGLKMAEANGMPMEAGQSQAMESYAHKREMGVKKKYEAKSALGAAQGGGQQPQQAPQQNQQGPRGGM